MIIFYYIRVQRRTKEMLRLEKELRENLKESYERKMLTSISIAREIAVYAHRNQKRLNCTPYIFHPYRIADTYLQLINEQDENFDTDELCRHGIPLEGVIEVAWLHDVLEDTEYTEEEIADIYKNQGLETYYRLYMKTPLLLITHDKSEPYPLYIEKVCTHQVSALVKFLDLNDNSCPLELDTFGDFEVDRIHRYTIYMKRINDQYHFIEKLNAYNNCLDKKPRK